MQLSKAQKKDLSAIMKIVADAQRYLASLGIDQWQNGYPEDFVIQNDIDNNEMYILHGSENTLLGISMFTIQPESTYEKIEGKWLTPADSVYGVIHRMAVLTNYKKAGLAQFMFNEFEKRLKENGIKSMRIDTHKDNKGMQALLKKRNYTYCGVIYVRDGSPRLAFEKLV